jgi:hypothetical protein
MAHSSAASSISAFITVASMPIASAVCRDTPCVEASTPRSTLPPPTTTPMVTPSARAAARSAANVSMVGR